MEGAILIVVDGRTLDFAVQQELSHIGIRPLQQGIDRLVRVFLGANTCSRLLVSCGSLA